MVYRPNKGGNQESVYSQHKRYLAKNRDKRDPLVALDEDLIKTIWEHQEKGENIILMGDFNNNVRKGRIKKITTQLQLSETIIKRHGNNPPATQERNQKRTPVDESSQMKP